jgi:prepilin-type processing-associated H-X9-DG protein
VSAFKFSDLPQTAPVMYQQFAQQWTALRGMAQGQGINLPENILPPLATVQANVSPSVELSWTDATGFHMKSHSPFPGSDAFSNVPSTSTGAAGGAAVLTAIALPAMNRSREVANRVKCASNMRQVGQAILLYANEHKGNYPPDLGTLTMTEDIGPIVFLCPDSNKSLPKDMDNMTPEQKADWVNRNSDYVYVGQDMNFNGPPDRVVMYENIQDHGQGMNMLYGDGHVEFQMRQVAQQLINGLKNQPAGK